MATVAPTFPARSKADARVQADIDRAVGRIRANDLLLGGLVAAVLLLGFTAGMVLLDARFELPMPARQLALGGFAVALAVVGYLFAVRPLRRAVNPRYAARRVEGTIEGSKNAVINWVDLQDRDLPPTVRAAVGQSAAGNLQSADVAKATEVRSVVWLGAAAGLLAAGLMVLFVVLRPAPFTSLVKRTFNPFVAREIATRTTLTLTEPAGGDATVTAGDSMTVAVDVGGSVPPADGPKRLRVQVWHADAAEPDDLPLEPGPGNDWRLTLPASVIQNGFQYRVVGGDARTGDHRVTVRSRPLVIGFEARYESPAYTRIPVEVGREPKIEGYRGTKVTLTARTNRPLKRGTLKLDGKPDPIAATVDGEAMRFELTLNDSDNYRLGFTSASDETSELTPPYPVKVLTDQPPTLSVGKPAEDEVTLPANGTLTIDGEAADDFGLVSVTLKMRVVAPYPLTLKDRPYRGGKDFRRADGTHPTRLADADGSQTGYRETVPLASLVDTSGKPLPFDPALVVEYWLEATDNCAVPRANVGVSPKKKLRLTPAVTEPAKKQAQDKAAADRQADQQQHEKAQDKQLAGEQRQPKQLRPEDKPQPQEPGQPGEPKPGQGDQPKPTGDQPPPNGGEQPKAGAGQQPGSEAKPDPTKPPAGEPNKQPEPKPGDASPEGQPPTGNDPSGQPKTGGDGGKPEPGAKREPSPADKKLDDQAAKLKEAMRGQGGERKPETAPAPTPADRAAEKEKQQGVQQAIDDLNGSDPDKQQAARDKLDKELGEEKRKEIEKIQKGLKSDDPKEREAARKEMGELDRETGTSSAGVRGDRKEDVERLSRELNSEDQGTRENAEKQAEQKFGKQGRDELKQAGQKLDSPDKPKQDEGKKDVDELVKKQKDKPKPPPAAGDQPKGGETPKGGDQPKGGEKPSADQVRQQANDLTSKDEAKREAAEKAMDKQVGSDARKDLQQKLGSSDAKQQQAGKDQAEKMAQQAGGGETKPTPEQVKEMTDAARDLNSPDDAKRQAAEQKLDNKLGKPAREQMQQLGKDLQSKDEKTRQAAERQVKDAAEQMAGGKPPDAPKPPAKEEIEQAAEAAKDLNSPDAAKRKAAEQKLDQQIGEGGRKELQQKLKENQDADTARKAEQAAKDQAAKGGKPQPTPEQTKELAEAAKDLTSPDPAKREAAEKKLDGAIGKENREKLQKEQAAGQPDPKATKDAAEKAVKDAKAAEQAVQELADTAKDLTSKDDAKRQAAEQKLDRQVGKDAREQIQKLQDDLQSSDPKTQEAAKQQVKDALDKLRGKLDAKQPWKPGGGTDGDNPGEKYADDLANRLKTAELQLTDFKKARGNKEVLGKAGFTPEEYERFYAEYEKRVTQLRTEAAKPRPDKDKPATAPPTVIVSGAGKIEKKDGGPTTGGPGGGKPAPGYGDAQKKFAAGASKGGPKPPEAPKQP